ncbi:MAG: TetR/AcrR family transcriptional regulator [Clostridia bacterium]
MKKENLHKERMRTFFLDAAIELVYRNEKLSARKIGDLAGYSYATIYNYFTDLKELKWFVIDKLFDDIGKEMQKVHFSKDPLDRLLNVNKTYIKYFSDYPHIFRFIYNSNLGTPPDSLKKKFQMPAMRVMLNEIINECIEFDYLDENDINVISDIISTSNRGLIAMHVANKDLLTREDLVKRSERIIKYLFRGRN